MGAGRAVTDRDELALRFLTDVTWRYKAAAGQEGGAGAEDTDFLMAPQRRAFRLELCFAPNELFEDEALWLDVSWRGGDIVACAGSGVRWKPGKCLTARQRDVAAAGGAAKYRPSLFLLFEPTAGDQGPSGGKGLMDPHEKLAIARALRFARAPAHARTRGAAERLRARAGAGV